MALLTMLDVETRLIDITDNYNYERSRYRFDQYTRQSADSLLKALAPLGEDCDFTPDEARKVLHKLDYDRPDWRDAAMAARVLPALRRNLQQLILKGV